MMISKHSSQIEQTWICIIKIGLAYGSASGRDISTDYPSAAIDIQTNIEFELLVQLEKK